MGEGHTALYLLFYECESNSKPAYLLYNRNPFLPEGGGRFVDIQTFQICILIVAEYFCLQISPVYKCLSYWHYSRARVERVL